MPTELVAGSNLTLITVFTSGVTKQGHGNAYMFNYTIVALTNFNQLKPKLS